MDTPDFSKPKTFWQRPEGMTGALFLGGLFLGGGYLLYANAAAIGAFLASTLNLALVLVALAVVLYMVLDPKMRNLVWYMYKSVMRSVTGLFVQLDPIGILKSYVDDMQSNLRKMSKQIGNLKGQSRKLKTIMDKNSKDIHNSLAMAKRAKETSNEKQFLLNTRKAARLKESNGKYAVLQNKITVLYRVLSKMHQNSEILLEDTKDQVKIKEQERSIIRTSHSAMSSAMSVIKGDPDKRAMFDAAMENIAEDVSNKVGEMERFMDVTANFMDSIDLQQGVFEEKGMKMLEQWEKESTSLLLGDDKQFLLSDNNNSSNDYLDLDSPIAKPESRKAGNDNKYDNLFD